MPHIKSRSGAEDDDPRAAAFEAAVDLLGPFPWSAPPEAIEDMFLSSRPWLRLPEQVSRSDMTDALRGMLKSYDQKKSEDRHPARPKEVLGRFAAIETMARDLAQALSMLDVSERRLLNGGFGGFIAAEDREAHPDLPDRAEWRRLKRAMFGVLPDLSYEIMPPAPIAGRAEVLLSDLAEYIRARRIEMTDGDLDLRDRGGPTTLQRKLHGTPIWHLVGDVCHLLSRVPGWQGDAAALAQLLHEAATGECREGEAFETALKGYRKVLANYIAKKAEFEAKAPPPLDISDEEFMALAEKYTR